MINMGISSRSTSHMEEAREEDIIKTTTSKIEVTSSPMMTNIITDTISNNNLMTQNDITEVTSKATAAAKTFKKASRSPEGVAVSILNTTMQKLARCNFESLTAISKTQPLPRRNKKRLLRWGLTVLR